MAPLAEAATVAEPTTPVTVEDAAVLKVDKEPEAPLEPEEDAVDEAKGEDASENQTSEVEVEVEVEVSQADGIEDEATDAVAEAAAVESGRRKRVQFEDADVVEFEPTMWTATVASDGVPVGMSTSVRRRTRRRLDSFEDERELQRVDRQMYMEFGYLEPDERLDILENAGHSLSVLSHVENENVRINRERWESNEYDLMYQYGLGEVPVMEMSDDDEMAVGDLTADDAMMCLDDSDDGEYFFNSRNLLVDADVRYAMEEMDAYDVNPRLYEDLNVDYASDCILGDDDDSDESNELPYGEDSFDTPIDASEAAVDSPVEMSSSPSDVADGSSCLLAACAVRAKVASPVASPSVANEAASTVVMAV